MNTGFYKDLDTNFEQACYLCENEFSHEELLELLKNGNIPQKQIAALKFDYVNSENDARALVSVCKMPPKIFADATIDINANICRLVVDSVKLLKPFDEFVSEYVNFILTFTVQALDELDKFIFRDKKYVINKQLFK